MPPPSRLQPLTEFAIAEAAEMPGEITELAEIAAQLVRDSPLLAALLAAPQEDES